MIARFVGLGALAYTWVSGITLVKSAVQGVQDGASAIEAATGAIKATTSAIGATTGAIEAATGAILAIAKRVDSVVGAVQAAVSAMKDTQELLAQLSQAPRYDNEILQRIEDIGGVHCLAIGLAVGLAIGLLVGIIIASRIWAEATHSVLAKKSAIDQAPPATSPQAPPTASQAPLEESVERVESTEVIIPGIAVQPTEFAIRAEPVTGTNEDDYSRQRVGTGSSTKAPGPSDGVLAASSSHAIIQPVVARASPSEEGKAAEGTNASGRSSSAVATPIPAAQHKEQVSSAGTERTNKVQPNSTGISQEAAHIGYDLWVEAQDADLPEAVSVAEPMSASEPSSVAGLLAAVSTSLLTQVGEQGAETDSAHPQSPAVRRRTIVNEPADGSLVDDYASVVAMSELRLRRHRRWSANSEPATPTATSIAAKKRIKSEARRMFIMADKTMIPRRERRGSLGYIADRLVKIKMDFSTKVVGSLEAAPEVFEAYRAQTAESERPAAPHQPTGPPPARAWQVAGQGASTSGNQQPRNSQQQQSNSRAGNDQRQQQSSRRGKNRQQARSDQPNHGQQQQQHNGQQQHNNQQQNGGQPRPRQNWRGNNRGHGNNHS
ncbi:hypothetical protein GGH13_002033 [Coemansia sp. S155-1]|nr:hypothetical protein H4S03_000821 [Coemansia sp. S3946]KAJ2073390.1 hypothetical protein GGH13_002033 [Coemansia sp. S155-1]